MRQTDLVVLGAGRPTGFGAPAKPRNGRSSGSSLPWIRAAVAGQVEVCHFVAGYAIEDVKDQIEGFSIEYNARWEETGSAASLLCAPLQPGKAVLVTYADVVFRERIVQDLLADSSDIAIAIDSRWRERFVGRTRHDMEVAEKVQLESGALIAIGRHVDATLADAEFAGLARFSKRAVAILSGSTGLPPELREKGSLVDTIAWLALDRRLSLSCHDVEGDWAELNAPQDLARFVLGTKAETLDRLRPLASTIHILDQVRFTVGEWVRAPDKVLLEVRQAFAGGPVIVRSSARTEDGWISANAGAFLSVADVDSNDVSDLGNSIEQVIRSYGTRSADDQVLVQPMLRDVVANGVLFTRTLSTCAPYFVVNYNQTPGSTDAVTAGSGESHVLYIHHDAAAPPFGAPSWVASLIEGARELIDLVGYDTLDLEFVIGASGSVHLLQLRPIAVTQDAQFSVDDAMIRTELHQATGRYAALQQAANRSGSAPAVFGVMPDWNPAEIIGTRPSLLSVSLYRYLICDETWARQRAEYGYHDVRPQPLLVSFAGHPYVNVRASFRSFVPASVPEPLADRLVDHYVERLIADPALHDKIEFEIAYTCLSFDFDDKAATDLLGAGFTAEDVATLRKGLAEVTRIGIARFAGDLKMIEVLAARYHAVMGQSLHPLERACTLLNDCRNFGMLPFAHMARSGFVAMTMLRSAVAKGLIDQRFFDQYLHSISTVAKDFVRDGTKVRQGTLAWDVFLQRYGHLRPGTYDITAPAYHENDGRLLREAIKSAGPASDNLAGDSKVTWPPDAWPAMRASLTELGIEIKFADFNHFLRCAIEGREYAKFMFSRNLSQALDDLAAYGRMIGLDRDTLSKIPAESYFSLRAGEGFGDPAAFIRDLAALYEPRRLLCRSIELPPLIHNADQFFAFAFPQSEPNFVTIGATTRPALHVTAALNLAPAELNGSIVIIENADPGFDWLFGCNIAGLITQYGGANSHMAIRTAEFGIPAAIGVGNTLFERLKNAKMVRLDCLNRKIDILR